MLIGAALPWDDRHGTLGVTAALAPAIAALNVRVGLEDQLSALLADSGLKPSSMISAPVVITDRASAIRCPLEGVAARSVPP